MPKKYDFKKAKEIILERKERIDYASLGMQEDWFWTTETVFKNGEFQINLDTVKTIAGISGSSWATPILSIEYKDGSSEIFDCYIEDNPKNYRMDNIDQQIAFCKATGGFDRKE